MSADVDRIAYDPLYAMNNVQMETVKGPMRISAMLQEGSKAQRVAYYMRPDVQIMLLNQLAAVGIEVGHSRTGKNRACFSQTLHFNNNMIGRRARPVGDRPSKP